MAIQRNIDKIIPRLEELYRSFGCRKYKMKRFEEYDFYLENKSFLKSENIIAFNDGSGRLLALKPDVTLSIVKSSRQGDEGIKKVYYNENVFRMSEDNHDIKEIPQVGLEYIGEIDDYSECEAVLLALKSLQTVSRDYAMDISHMGFTGGLLDETGISFASKKELLSCLSAKNRHGISELCSREKIEAEVGKALLTLAGLHGPFDKTMSEARKLVKNIRMEKALDELCGIYEPISSVESYRLNLDFSIINDMDYYSGVIFQGFVNGISNSVLSGGRYDPLLAKFGNPAGAIGFAVYLDQIELMQRNERELDADVLVLYDKKSDRKELIRLCTGLIAEGKSVSAALSAEGITYGELCDVTKEKTGK